MATVIRVTMEIADGEDVYQLDGIGTNDFPESPLDKPMPEAKKSTAPEGLWGDMPDDKRKIYDPYA